MASFFLVFSRARRIFFDAFDDLARHHTTLVCAGLTLYLVTVVLPLGAVLWWFAPHSALIVQETLLRVMQAFAGDGGAQWLALYLAEQANKPWQAASVVPLAISLLVSLYAASNFAFYLREHIVELWGGGKGVPTLTRGLQQSFVARLRFLAAVIGLIVVLVVLYGYLRAALHAIAPAVMLAPLLLSLTMALLATFLAFIIASTLAVPLFAAHVWRVSVLASALMVTASVLIIQLFHLSRVGGVSGVAFEPVAVLVWVWTLLWLLFTSLAVGRRLSRALPM
ncbi:hypothetical protein D6792_03450 [Candidatus Parcubacteria bacterium]|nr:MAG: hypothetical protein D6792_03450 [Candidatus Parcubacteria bacterium]